ncbi:hypothetical protein [Cellulomonas composti]|uniref:Uncharacterized protein n=1 Tax=Cellulomonas composti TaxID=266130 RepID=A0A511JDD2_9CELL|nr:hypothetical protein [Cellulomonas composti]GEL95799.1 hypothetical protein CCO02nite_24570 [Cellulomonas composti]
MNDELHDLLADLADTVARGAHGLDETAAKRVTTRVRRRRVARQTGTGVAAACAVGALGIGAAQVREGSPSLPAGTPGTTSTPPSRTPTPAPTRAASSDPTVDDDLSDATPQERAAALGPAAGIFWCGEEVGVTIQTRPDADGIVLAADDDLSMVLSAGSSTDTTVEVAGGSYALVGADGTVVGFVVPDDDEPSYASFTPGSSLGLDGPLHLVACEVDGPETGDRLVAWPYVPVVLHDFDAGTAQTVVAIADPRTITVP